MRPRYSFRASCGYSLVFLTVAPFIQTAREREYLPRYILDSNPIQCTSALSAQRLFHSLVQYYKLSGFLVTPVIKITSRFDLSEVKCFTNIVNKMSWPADNIEDATSFHQLVDRTIRGTP